MSLDNIIQSIYVVDVTTLKLLYHIVKFKTLNMALIEGKSALIFNMKIFQKSFFFIENLTQPNNTAR